MHGSGAPGPAVALQEFVPGTIEMSSCAGQYVVAETGDWSATVRQTLPVFARVLVSVRPTWVVPSVCAITPQFLKERRIRAVIWDVDGTLAHHHSATLDPGLAEHLEHLMATEGLRHAVLSNCGEKRFEELSGLFPALPIIKAYRGHSGVMSRVRTGVREAWSAEPAGRLRPLRKPDPLLVECALQAMQIQDRRSVAIVGDQCLTDVAAANLAGIMSIKVPTLGRASYPPAVRLLQCIDTLLFHIGEAMRRRPSTGDAT